MKEKIRQRLNKGILIERLREISEQLEKDALKVGGKTITIPESAMFTLEWKEKANERKLEIEIGW